MFYAVLLSWLLTSKIILFIIAANVNIINDNFPLKKITEENLQLWSKKFCNWKISLRPQKQVSHVGKVIGMASGPAYTFEKLLPFCKSIRLSGFQGDVLIGISKLSRSQEKSRNDMFRKFNITGVYLDGVKGDAWGQSICRYHVYMEFVNYYASANEPVLISDVRDVFFQDNPFTSFPFGAQNFLNERVKLLLFSEGLNDISAQKATLRNVKINFRWLRNIYGPKKSSDIAKKTVLCSGTTIGTGEGLLKYARAILLEGYLCLKRNPRKFDGKRGHVCSGGADQAFHNYLFWNQMLDKAVFLHNAAGPVYTIGIFRGKPVPSLNFALDINGDVISPIERGLQYPVPVIHQWDRHKDLLNNVFKKFELKSEGVSVNSFRSHLLEGGFSAGK